MKNKQSKILLGVILIISIACIIGFSYAFFAAIIKGNENAKLMTINAGTMELTFVDNNSISLENTEPGKSNSKTFSIENTGTLDDEYNYNIKLVDVNTTFLKRDLKYILEECEDSVCNSIKTNGIKEEGYINTDSTKNGEMYLAVNIPRPEKAQIKYYKLTIDFQELNINQNYNQGATFSGKVNVDIKKDAKLYVQAPNKPELYQGMIPVYFKNNEMYIADVNEEWYDYSKKEWANAVLINYTDDATRNKFYTEDELNVNTKIEEQDVLQMYVWIPRYRYKLFNAVNGTSSTPQMINVEFEKGTESTGNVSCTIASNGKETCQNDVNGNWYTHPAFTFGNTELTGIWVGKFETSGDEKALTIIPNIASWSTAILKTRFDAARNIEEQNASKYNLDKTKIDTHMMKNMDWGAMAYLTQSLYGRCDDNGVCEEVTMNGRSDFMTGYANTEYTWETKEGQKASTTGNMYGIYDASGGNQDYVMGGTVGPDGKFYSSYAGFDSAPDSKYYDLYEYDTDEYNHARGHLGDATRETLSTFGDRSGGWNGDFAIFPAEIRPWFLRGADYSNDDNAGVFAFIYHTGNPYPAFRTVLTAQDGN